jgi:hypothetical protein
LAQGVQRGTSAQREIKHRRSSQRRLQPSTPLSERQGTPAQSEDGVAESCRILT